MNRVSFFGEFVFYFIIFQTNLKINFTKETDWTGEKYIGKKNFLYFTSVLSLMLALVFCVMMRQLNVFACCL